MYFYLKIQKILLLPLDPFFFSVYSFQLVLVLFVSQLPKYGIPYRFTFCSLKHSLHLDVI